MRLVRALFAPLAFLIRLLLRPFALFARRRAAGDGWIELALEGELREYRPAPRRLLRRLLDATDDGPQVILSELERLAREVARDPRARGLLVRLGPIGGGWTAALRVRRALAQVRDAGKKVVVHVTQYAGNREYAVATASTSLWTVPPAIIAPVGSAAQGLFLGEALAKVGVRFEVAAAGRFKSAPEALTRTERTEADREQATALVSALDEALIGAVMEGRKLERDEARARIDEAPYTGARAQTARLTDGTARDEDLPQRLREQHDAPEAPQPVDADEYLDARVLTPLWRPRGKRVALVEVHGAIVDRVNPYLGMLDRAAVERAVVSDLRAALAHPQVGAVVLHVDSRGGSVIASDTIYGAVKRLDADKPVIACFGDVAASGGYYVACGARAIVASPLTITGSIGVFAMMPTWPGLAEKLAVHPDAIHQRRHATMADPWRARTDEERAHGQAEVEALYREFLAVVAAARKRTEAQIHEVAQGRVWIGEAAHQHGLVDGLGGLEEAVARAKEAAGGRFAEEPVVVRARKPRPRPAPPSAEAAPAAALLGVDRATRQLALELLALRAASPHARAWAWSPVAP